MKAGFDQSVRAASARQAVLLVGLMAAALTGCRHDASQRDAYIRELRMQEDEIYELQDYMSEYQHLLREQRRENAQLRAQLASQNSTAKGKSAERDLEQEEDEDEGDSGVRSLLDRPRRPVDEPDGEELDEPEFPGIDLGDPAMPAIDFGDPAPAGELEVVPPGEPEDLSQLPFDTATRLASSSIAEQLPVPTVAAESCAMYAEQLAGDPAADVESVGRGVMAIVEPLAADGSAGAFTGGVSLMLVDPEENDQEWELARWNFTAEEVEAAWRDESRRVLDLPIAVPASVPVDRLLELWVRLQPTGTERKIFCSTGLTLSAKVAIENPTPVDRVTTEWAAANRLDLPGQPAGRPARWTAVASPLESPVREQTEVGEADVETARLEAASPEWSPQRK